MCIKNEDGNYSYLYPVVNPNIQFASVPRGIIVMYGNSSTIPDGWVLYNGENNTPDLRGKFILGNSDEYTVGSTGGEKEHTLTVEEIPAHGHTNIFNYGTTSGSFGNAFTMNASPQDIITQNSVEVGNNQPHNNMPPYYVLCYIMKI